jgi:hypothetical protein
MQVDAIASVIADIVNGRHVAEVLSAMENSPIPLYFLSEKIGRSRLASKNSSPLIRSDFP